MKISAPAPAKNPGTGLPIRHPVFQSRPSFGGSGTGTGTFVLLRKLKFNIFLGLLSPYLRVRFRVSDLAAVIAKSKSAQPKTCSANLLVVVVPSGPEDEYPRLVTLNKVDLNSIVDSTGFVVQYHR